MRFNCKHYDDVALFIFAWEKKSMKVALFVHSDQNNSTPLDSQLTPRSGSMKKTSKHVQTRFTSFASFEFVRYYTDRILNFFLFFSFLIFL